MFKLSDDTNYLKQANNMLYDNTILVFQDDNFVIKAYYSVNKKQDYGLNLNLRILNLHTSDISNLSIKNTKTNSVINNIAVKSLEYEEIKFEDVVTYDENVNIQILDVNYIEN